MILRQIQRDQLVQIEEDLVGQRRQFVEIEQQHRQIFQVLEEVFRERFDVVPLQADVRQ